MLGYTDEQNHRNEHTNHNEDHKPCEAGGLETFRVNLDRPFTGTAGARQAMLHSVLSGIKNLFKT